MEMQHGWEVGPCICEHGWKGGSICDQSIPIVLYFTLPNVPLTYRWNFIQNLLASPECGVFNIIKRFQIKSERKKKTCLNELVI